MQGDISVATAGKRPHLTAKVTSNAVDISDIEGFWAAKPDQPGSTKGEQAAAAPLKPRGHDGRTPTRRRRRARPSCPRSSIRLDKLRAMDVDLDFQGKSIKSSGPALDDIKVTLKVVDGKAMMQPFELGIFQGSRRRQLDVGRVAKNTGAFRRSSPGEGAARQAVKCHRAR